MLSPLSSPWVLSGNVDQSSGSLDGRWQIRSTKSPDSCNLRPSKTRVPNLMLLIMEITYDIVILAA